MACLFALGFSFSVMAEDAQTWKINMKDAAIRAFVSQISDITGKSFIIDSRVKGKVTVISHVQMEKDEVFELFLSVLRVYGYVAVPSGNVVKIVPTNNAKQDTIRLNQTPRIEGEEMVTRVIAVENSPASELVPILRPMVPQYGHLAAVPSANALIISDHSANIKRVMQIIKKIDGAESEELEVVQLKEAWVGDVVTLLESLTPVKTGGKKSSKNTAARVKVVAEERTNRLIIKGEKKARNRVKALIKELDKPSPASGTTKVVYLRHADAVKVAELLKGLVADLSAPASRRGNKNSKSKAAPATEINIQADETLNALVIRGEPSDISEVLEIVQQLDVRRSQVLIEAAIIEVFGNISNALGVQWGATDSSFDTPIAGVNFTNLGVSLDAVVKAIDNPQAAAGASLADGITLIGGERNTAGTSGFGVLVQALAGASNTNTLSTPSILTLDNEEAEIVVGQNVPFITGSSTSSASGTSNPFQTITREDVGLTLKVVPQINEGDVIRLKIEQESSAVVSAATGGAADIITNKRSIKTTILANDGETIVLGGLIQDDEDESESKVPLLGDIPFVGRLFSSKRKTQTKRNLLVFLQPKIIRDQETVREVTQAKYQQTLEMMVDVDELGGFSLFREEQEKLPETASQMWDRGVKVAPLPAGDAKTPAAEEAQANE